MPCNILSLGITYPLQTFISNLDNQNPSLSLLNDQSKQRSYSIAELMINIEVFNVPMTMHLYTKLGQQPKLFICMFSKNNTKL